MKVFYLGVNEDYPQYLQRKIVLSNQIAFLIGLTVALPFVFISLIHFPPLTFIPVTGIVVCLSVLVFNYLKLHNLSRVVISALPISLSSLYGSYLSNAGEPVIPGIALLTICFAFTFFLLFDIREKALLIGMGIYVSSLVVFMDSLNILFEIELDTQVIRTGYLAKLTLVVSLIMGGGSTFILIKQNHAEEGRSNQLLKLAEKNHKEMLVKEEELKENLRMLNEAQEAEKKRQWISEGLGEAIKIIRDHKEVKSLCSDVICFTVKYLKANQGGLFIVNEDEKDNKFLELQAAYAYERKKFLQKRVEIGEGLLGQAYLEKQYVYLNEIPNDYVIITSGLGTANPRSLLIVPLAINEDILGIIEVASFNEFDSHEIEFLESLGEDIAAALKNLRINEQTRHLMEEMQRQTELMKSQEEELRQNLEEMQASQEEFQRREKEYIEITKKFEQVNGVPNVK